MGVLTAYANTETLRVREEPSLEAGIVGLLADGQAVEAIAEEGDWVRVSYEARRDLSVRVCPCRVWHRHRRIYGGNPRERGSRARQSRCGGGGKSAYSKREAVFATASELDILAALIQCEAGGEPYEGQVAVGAVVMNRVRNGGYPNSITEVIYASGQFVPASGGRMESLILNKTTKASCVQAAQEAINGACNVGDALHFRRNNGRPGLVIGNHVFW